MRLNHRVEGKPSLFICSPAYSGEFNCHFVTSLLQTCDLLKENNIGYEVYFSVYDSLVARTRNELVDKFLKSKCTHVLMVDSDQGWEPDKVLKMLELDKDFLTGAVPARKIEETYALKIKTDEFRKPIVTKEGLLVCSSNGVAFGLIKRSVFEKIKENNPSKHDPYPYFQHRYFDDGSHYGEDTYFVNEWMTLGDVFIYPDITFTHGPITANYHEFLLRQKGGSKESIPVENVKIKEIVKEIKNQLDKL